MTDNVRQLRSQPAEQLKCNGVMRSTVEHAVVVYFNRSLTDDELDFFHECSARAAALMP